MQRPRHPSDVLQAHLRCARCPSPCRADCTRTSSPFTPDDIPLPETARTPSGFLLPSKKYIPRVLPASPERNYPPGHREYSSASYVAPQHVMAFDRPRTLQQAIPPKITTPNGALTPSQIAFQPQLSTAPECTQTPIPAASARKQKTPDCARTPPPSPFPPQTNYSTRLRESSPP